MSIDICAMNGYIPPETQFNGRCQWSFDSGTPLLEIYSKTGQLWWYTLVIPALGRLRQEDFEFEASLGLYSENLSLKKKERKKKIYSKI
jgi:hypothetical protein